MARSSKSHEVVARYHHISGAQAFNLAVFGDQLAARESYKAHRGLEAVRYYLMVTHGWLPRDVRSLSNDDLPFATAELFEGWVLPTPARGIYPRLD